MALLDDGRPAGRVSQIKPDPALMEDEAGLEEDFMNVSNQQSRDLTERDKHGTAMIVNSSYGPSLLDDQLDLKFGYYRSTSKEINMRKRRLLAVESDQISYCGMNINETDSTDNNALSYYIGVFDPSTNKMKLIDADYYELFPVHKDDYDLDAAKPNTNESEMSYSEKSDRLVKEFGSSKGKRLVNARLRNEVKGEALEQAMGSAMNEASLTTDVKDVKVNELTNESTDIMPRCYRDAKCIEESYLLSDIISEGEMNALYDVCSVFANATKDQISEWKSSQTYPSYILDQLQFISPNETQRNERARSLLYLYYMILLYDMNAASLRKPHPLPVSIPDVIRKRLLDKFTATVQDKSGRNIRCMPKRLKDSLVLHILILCLIIDGFHCNCTALKKDLQLSDARLKTFVASLGGRMKIENSSKTAVKYFMLLPWPLDFRLVEKNASKRSRR